jgi:hypothetical protein
MEANKKSTFVPQSDNNSGEQEKAPIFAIQTGVRAGATYEPQLLERVDHLLDEVESFLAEFRVRFNPFV